MHVTLLRISTVVHKANYSEEKQVSVDTEILACARSEWITWPAVSIWPIYNLTMELFSIAKWKHVRFQLPQFPCLQATWKMTTDYV